MRCWILKHQAKKRYGQNFLTDKNLLEKIVKEAHIQNLDVIEVGPGRGALTGFLAQQAKHVVAYEIDQSLKQFLNPLASQYDNLSIIYQDFLKADLTELSDHLNVVANVPYYITTPILFKILDSDQIQTAVLMIQKEVANRLLAKPNTKEYNALSILLQYQTDIQKVLDVNRKMFYPIPNVDSVVIRIVKKESPELNQAEEKRFEYLVKAAFKQKRKTLVNNWHEAFDIGKIDIEAFLNENQISKNARAESLSVSDFIRLSKVWKYD